MNTKRIMRWVIVLFLLAALPVMTAVMAQGQEPAGKQLPVVTEPSESAAPEANVNESEPNNTMGQADVMSINDVMAATITNGDVDYFKFYVGVNASNFLFDIDAQSIGSGLNPTASLFTSGGVGAHGNDDTDTLDSMFYFAIEGTGWWYVRVEGVGGSTGNYNLIVSSPLLISAAAANLGTGYVAGIPFRSEDILAWSDLNTGEEKWVMLVDGSDLGWKSLTNLTTLWGGVSVSVGFAKNQTLQRQGGGTYVVTPWDSPFIYLLRVGGITEARCPCDAHAVWFGYNLSLSTASEKPDALSGVNENWAGTPGTWYDLYVSTTGKASVPGPGGTILKPADEDVYLNQMTGDSNPWFYKYTFFDGSMVTGLAAEDVVAMEYDPSPSTMFLTILGTGNIAGHAVSQKDIFAINMPNHTWGGVVWHGPDHGWNYNIDAIDYPGW